MDNKDTPTVNITINGQAVAAKAGQSVIQAADDAGIFIPRYCYHPDLPVAGVCRMCMCEVEKNPKLQIACNTPVAEGMIVHTKTQRIKDTVKNILEYHLINHPIDCPICDKSGECKLQDFYIDYGLYQSRLDYEKVHKPKVVDIGTIVLDSERCILCSRCVRFTDEITKTHELGIFNRGDRSELRTYDHGPLRNDYTGNLADICPVGALTAKDFRFQCRVWFLEKVDSVCTLCARGCNTAVSMHPQTKKLYRVEPRRNPEVNSSWICDTGRWGYHYVSDEDRLKTPLRYEDGQWRQSSWQDAFVTLSEQINAAPSRVLVALSTQLTNEEIADCISTLSGLGVTAFTRVCDERVVDDRSAYDGLLKHRDQTANVLGFEAVTKAIGVPWLDAADRKAKLSAGGFDRVIVLGSEGKLMPGLQALLEEVPQSTRVAVHCTSRSPMFERVDLVLPNTSSYEKNGTVISALGVLAKVNPVIPAQFTSRDAHAVVFGIVQGSDAEAAPKDLAQRWFEQVVVESVLLGNAEDWRKFCPSGISLKEVHQNAGR